jgi:hypothetical protein
VDPNDLPFFVRFWLAITVALRIVVDAALARRVRDVAASPPALPEAPEAKAPPTPAPARAAATDGALGLLALLQREGRLVDFLQQDIATFSDGEIGAAARVVHEGCRRALSSHLEIARVRTESEGSQVTLAEGFDAHAVKLTGNVRGSAPYHGVLRHSGWRVRQARLPELVEGYDATVLAPAEVEL